MVSIDISTLITTIVATTIVTILSIIVKKIYDFYIKNNPVEIKCFYQDEGSRILIIRIDSRVKIQSCKVDVIFVPKDSGNEISCEGIWNSIFPENRTDITFNDKNSANFLILPLTCDYESIKNALEELGGAEEAYSKESDIYDIYRKSPDELINDLARNVHENYSKAFRELNGKEVSIDLRFKIRRISPSTGPIFEYTKKKILTIMVRNNIGFIVGQTIKQCSQYEYY